MQQGIPIVTVDRDVSTPNARIAFIGDNDETLGREETQAAIDALKQRNVPKPWHVVVLQGTLGASVSIGRLKGTMDVLQPLVTDHSVDIVLNQSANFETETAQTMVGAELAKTTDVQLIVCANDAMALGAINALKDHGMTPGQKTLVAGADAQPESLDAVKGGTQFDTVTHSPFVEAYWAVEAIANELASHTKPPADKFPHGDVIIPMTLVTQGRTSARSRPGVRRRRSRRCPTAKSQSSGSRAEVTGEMNQPAAERRRPLSGLPSLVKTFGPVRAVDGVSLDFYAGEVLGIIGDNGAGKSTFLSLLTGFHHPGFRQHPVSRQAGLGRFAAHGAQCAEDRDDLPEARARS